MALVMQYNVLALNAEDCLFKPELDKSKDYNIGICCFTARSKSEDRLARYQDNVSE